MKNCDNIWVLWKSSHKASKEDLIEYCFKLHNCEIGIEPRSFWQQPKIPSSFEPELKSKHDDGQQIFLGYLARYQAKPSIFRACCCKFFPFLAFSKVGSENTVINTLVPKIGPKNSWKESSNQCRIPLKTSTNVKSSQSAGQQSRTTTGPLEGLKIQWGQVVIWWV